jgi:hypothetical protein
MTLTENKLTNIDFSPAASITTTTSIGQSEFITDSTGLAPLPECLVEK